MDIVFAGTPEISVKFLDALRRTGNVRAVITRPDRPAGRKRAVTPPPVKAYAERAGIKTFQPENASGAEFLETLGKINPFLLAVVAYGGILRKPMLDLPEHGCLNLHLSLLPAYRGPCPVEWALINGEETTGVTCIMMDEGVDTGGIILNERVEISPSDTRGTLEEKLSEAGIRVLAESIRMLERGPVRPRPQEGEPTYAPFLKKEDLRIDWSDPARRIHDRVRALAPRPGARSRSESGRDIIIMEAEIAREFPGAGERTPGEIIKTDGGGAVAAGEGALVVKTVQPEGGKPQGFAEFLRGHRIKSFVRR